MVQLPSSLNDKTNKGQKAFAFILMIAATFLGIKLVNYVAPTIIELFKNIWYMIGLGVPLAIIVGYVVYNPAFIWGLFKTMSWNLTKWFIKMDPLSVMDRYADHLEKKLRNLENTKVQLEGKKTKLHRLMENLKEEININLKQAEAALKQGQQNVASLAGSKIATNQGTLKMYLPIYDKMEKNLKFLGELAENWRYSQEKLRHTIDAKRQEHETLKEMAKGLGLAREFARGDTEEGKLYQESIKQLEAQVSLNIAKIEDFEVSTKDMLGSIKVEKQMIQDEGLSVIEQYRKRGDLMLPDFSEAVVVSSVINKPSQLQSKFNLLNKTK